MVLGPIRAEHFTIRHTSCTIAPAQPNWIRHMNEIQDANPAPINADRTQNLFRYAQRVLDRMDRNLSLDEAKATLMRQLTGRRLVRQDTRGGFDLNS